VSDEYYFVLLVVVDQFIGRGLGHHDSESAGANSFFLADVHVCNRLTWMRNCSVLEVLEAETLSGIGDAVHQHARRAHVCDANFTIRIEFATPLDGVHQKLTKGLSYFDAKAL